MGVCKGGLWDIRIFWPNFKCVRNKILTKRYIGRFQIVVLMITGKVYLIDKIFPRGCIIESWSSALEKRKLPKDLSIFSFKWWILFRLNDEYYFVWMMSIISFKWHFDAFTFAEAASEIIRHPSITILLMASRSTQAIARTVPPPLNRTPRSPPLLHAPPEPPACLPTPRNWNLTSETDPDVTQEGTRYSEAKWNLKKQTTWPRRTSHSRWRPTRVTSIQPLTPTTDQKGRDQSLDALKLLLTT